MTARITFRLGIAIVTRAFLPSLSARITVAKPAAAA